MRTSALLKTAAAGLGLTALFLSTPAHAGDYPNVTATPPSMQTINGTKFTCFFAMAPSTSQYWWCLPSSDPGAAAMAEVVSNAFIRNHTIGVGCYSCQSVPGDSNWPGTKWYPDYVYEVTTGTRAYGN